MSDLIDRQAAIDAIVNTVSGIGLHDNSEVARYGATFRQHEIIDIIEGMPSVQPYSEADIQKMQDLEQAELQKAYECGRASAQPEIVRCKDCKHHSHDVGYGYDWCNRTSGVFRVKPEDFCSKAERRTDEQIRGFGL